MTRARAIALIGLLSCWTPAAADIAHAEEASEARFTGKITSITFRCAVDAHCVVVVDGHKSVDFGHDTRGAKTQPKKGQSDDLWSLQGEPHDGVGRTVEVFAAALGGDNYSIYGKATYYVRVVPKQKGR
jgi:hypothetical protein